MGGFRSPQEILEVAVLCEDVAERLVDDLIGRGMKKRCVLIDERRSRFIEPDAGGHLAGLYDLKQWHCLSPFRWDSSWD